MKNKLYVFFLILVSSADLHAGPGGQIAKELIKNPFVIGLVVILAILLSPLIAFIYFRELLKVNKTTKDIRNIAQFNNNFEWFSLKQRATAIFERVHSAWSKEDMQEASEWMTDWYWQNQQLVYLNRWQDSGLINHCIVAGIEKIKPVYLYYSDNEGGENSKVVLSISANMEDYLFNKKTLQVVKGEKGFKSVETYWTLTLVNQNWVVSNIEDPTSEYLKTANQILKPSLVHSNAQYIPNHN